MKKIKFLLLLFVIICFNSCTQHLIDDKGVVTRVELSDDEGIFNVYLKEIDKYPLCYDDLWNFPKTFYFKTSTLYHVGDTIYLQSNENN